MKSSVEVEINKPKEQVEKLFADPSNNPKWMLDLERYEPMNGEQGQPGSTYRLIPKKGNRIFLATVIARNSELLKLTLENKSVEVLLEARLIALTPSKTRLISTELFIFKGFFNTLFGALAGSVIKKAHRQHMYTFKDFAEEQKQ